MATVDLKRELRDQYRATSAPALVTVPARPFLMVDGAGDPNSAPAYREAIETLYPLAYALRAEIRRATGEAYVVMPLEGLWWSDDLNRFSVDAKDDWLWTMMISLPVAVEQVDAAGVLERTMTAKGLPAGGRVRLESFADGAAAQVLHVGPFAAEGPTVARLHDFIEVEGLGLAGTHHEIYLSDARRVAPDKWRTIVRQPVAEVVHEPTR